MKFRVFYEEGIAKLESGDIVVRFTRHKDDGSWRGEYVDIHKIPESWRYNKHLLAHFLSRATEAFIRAEIDYKRRHKYHHDHPGKRITSHRR